MFYSEGGAASGKRRVYLFNELVKGCVFMGFCTDSVTCDDTCGLTVAVVLLSDSTPDILRRIHSERVVLLMFLTSNRHRTEKKRCHAGRGRGRKIPTLKDNEIWGASDLKKTFWCVYADVQFPKMSNICSGIHTPTLASMFWTFSCCGERVWSWQSPAVFCYM